MRLVRILTALLVAVGVTIGAAGSASADIYRFDISTTYFSCNGETVTATGHVQVTTHETQQGRVGTFLVRVTGTGDTTGDTYVGTATNSSRDTGTGSTYEFHLRGELTLVSQGSGENWLLRYRIDVENGIYTYSEDSTCVGASA